jgi:hypothetical protein
VNAPYTTNHELFKGAIPSPSFHEHQVRAPFTVAAHYRATDNTTVDARVTQTPPMLNPTKFEREVIPATLNVRAQDRNANDVLRDKTVTVTAQASMTEAGVFHKSAEVLISKETPKGCETGVFVGVSRSNGENTYISHWSEAIQQAEVIKMIRFSGVLIRRLVHYIYHLFDSKLHSLTRINLFNGYPPVQYLVRCL